MSDRLSKANPGGYQRRLSQDVAYLAQLGTAELSDDMRSDRFWDLADRHIVLDPFFRPPRATWRGDWIERIPISETRNYVQRVLENMQIYRALVENNPKLLIEADLRRGG